MRAMSGCLKFAWCMSASEDSTLVLSNNCLGVATCSESSVGLHHARLPANCPSGAMCDCEDRPERAKVDDGAVRR